MSPRLLCGLALALAGVWGCDLSPYPTPSTIDETPSGRGGNDPGGGLTPIGGNDGGDPPPCGIASVPGTYVSQKDFAAAGREDLDAVYVGDDGAAWISLGYDTAFDVDGRMLAAPSDRDVVLLRIENGEAGDLHRLHGTGDQHVTLTTYDGALHVVGRVVDATAGGSAELYVDDVLYDGFADGDAFYLHIQGDETTVYRWTGGPSGAVFPRALTIDELGHPWVVGDFIGNIALSGTPGDLSTPIVTAEGPAPNRNGFVSRVSFGSERLTAIGPPAGEGAATDETRIAGVVPFNEDGGEVIVFGDFKGRLALGNGLYEVEGESDLWLARVEPDGTITDRARYDSPGAAYATSFLITPGGRGVILGTFSGDLGWLAPPDGNTGMFVSQVKLRDLKRGRARGFSAPTGDLSPTALARYPFGNGIVIMGQLIGEGFPLVGDIATNTDAHPDGFILALENDLDDRYAWHIEASGPHTLRGLATAPCQAAAVVGSFDGGSVTAHRLASEEAAITFSASSALDAYLLRLSY